MAKLKAKPGIKGVGVGGKEYAVDKKGFITVPDEFVPAVLDAGFVMAEGETQAAESASSDAAGGQSGGDGDGAGSGAGEGFEGSGAGAE